jgi:hypothetical protein
VTQLEATPLIVHELRSVHECLDDEHISFPDG